MEWVDFLNDPELNSNAKYHSPPNGSYLLGKVVHDVMECLTTYKGYVDIVSQAKIELSDENLSCLSRWSPKVEVWTSTIKYLRSSAEDLPNTSPEWPRLIAQVGQTVVEAPILQNEIRLLTLPLLERPRYIMQSLITTVTRLNLLLQDIQAQEYKRLWTITRYDEPLHHQDDALAQA